MAHSFTNLLTHIIFSTKDRVPHIDRDLAIRLHPYMGGILRETNIVPIAINGPADHVHLVVRMPATVCIADALRALKTNSSRWVHENWPERASFGWQTGYGAFSVSQSNLQGVCDYAAQQEMHHQRMTFQEEFIAFLKKHGIEYDERYIWE